MVFASLEYGLFVALTWLLYRLTNWQWRPALLLTASYLFYASFNVYYLPGVLLLVTLISYVAGLCIARASGQRQRYLYLTSGIALLVLILVGMKYLPFLATNLNVLLGFMGADTPLDNAPILATLGVSYYTFQAIAYLSDIYLEITPAETKLSRLALSYAFFPKILQGPIERAGDLLPQLNQPQPFCYADFRLGILLFGWGLLQKVVVADNLATFVDPLYANPSLADGSQLLLASYAYALQIFFDFSGYTAMALGTARLFGIRLSENFNRPYLATSVADFWRRWHMTFSRFILDYIFKPLQMRWRRQGTRATAAALLITFLISGLWHGASWNFIVWGLLHGFLLTIEVYWRPRQKRWHAFLRINNTPWLSIWQVVATFHLVCLLWVFFRATDISDALFILKSIVTPAAFGGMVMTVIPYFSGLQSLVELLLDHPYLLVLGLILLNPLMFKLSLSKVLAAPVYIRWPLYYLILFSVLLLSHDGDIAFIYLQF